MLYDILSHITPDLPALAGVAAKYAMRVAAAACAGFLGKWLAVPFIKAVLGMLGFSSVGVVAGTLAAWIQSCFYGATVAAGSLFSVCQSIAAGGGALLSAISTVGGMVAAAAALVAGLFL